MSGHLSGVQIRIREHLDWTIYVHSYAHRLNPVIVDSCKAVKFMTDFFDVLQRMYIFVSGSYVHPNWLELQKQMHPKETTIELKSFSETRWSAQMNACHAVKLRVDVILELLDQLEDESDEDRAVEAHSFLMMIDIIFVFYLLIFHDMISQMKAASDCLQKVKLNAEIACDLITDCFDFLKEKSSELECDKYV